MISGSLADLLRWRYAPTVKIGSLPSASGPCIRSPPQACRGSSSVFTCSLADRTLEFACRNHVQSFCTARQFLLELAYTWTCVFTSQGPFTRFVPSGAGQSVSAIVARELSTLASVELAIGRTDPSTKPKFAWCG